MARSAPKKLLLGLTVALILLFLIEGLASFVGALRAASRVQGLREEGHCEYDAELGWRHVKGFRKADFYAPGTTMTINSQGFRSAGGDFQKEVPTGRYRVVFLGDSFTMGFGVDDEKTFAARVEARCAEVEAINMGNGGYGIGQAYLWYRRDGDAFETDLLVFSVIDDDFRRLMLESFSGYPKPRLRLAKDELVVDNVPVPSGWSSRTAKLRAQVFLRSLSLGRAMTRLIGASAPKPPEIADFDPVARRVFRELKELCASRGRGFALVYLPTAPRGSTETPIAVWMRRMAAEESIPLVDLSRSFAALEAERRASFYRPDTHFTTAGNDFVAERLLDGLRALFPAFPRD